MSRRLPAAVLSALAVAGTVAGAYVLASQQTGAPVEQVAAESQGEVIRAAARLREMGLSPDAAAASLADAMPMQPRAAVHALVGGPRASVASRDPRQRYERVVVLVASDNLALAHERLAAAHCQPLTDPRDGGPPHPLLADCLARAPRLTSPWCLDGEVVGYAAGWQALPGDRAALTRAVRDAAGWSGWSKTVEGGRLLLDAEAASRGWERCEVTP